MPSKIAPANHTGILATLKVHINITIAVVLGAASLVIIFLHWFFPSIREELVFSVGVIGGASAIYLGFYTSKSLRVNVERQKQQNAFELLRDLYRVDTAAMILLIRDNFGKGVSAVDHCNKIEADKELHNSVLTVLGVFEDTSLAIQVDMACEKILYLSLGFLVPWMFENMKPFIDYRRDKDKDPTLYIEIEKLTKAWKEKKSIKDGTVFE
jgi:hypothetical protein